MKSIQGSSPGNFEQLLLPPEVVDAQRLAVAIDVDDHALSGPPTAEVENRLLFGIDPQPDVFGTHESGDGVGHAAAHREPFDPLSGGVAERVFARVDAPVVVFCVCGRPREERAVGTAVIDEAGVGVR
ncbi:hypothetical protein [Haladaptatus sp. GCM10025893]|uniref:hypothetical protein n=1 Tax=Haladaptatus sp. GCM10025893 TaxID=3252659 RepID=UPI00361B3F40